MSLIWSFFKRNDSTANCNECNRTISLGHVEKKKQTTKNIETHLEKIHPKKWHEYVSNKNEKIKEKKRKISDLGSNESTEKQVTLPELRYMVQPWPDDHPLVKKIDKSIMDLIIVDMLPYNLVEGAAFRRLNFGNPSVKSKYKMKSEKFFRTNLMPVTYEKVHKKVSNMLKDVEYISLTTDIWSNSTKSCSLLSLTAHFIDGPKRLKTVLGAMVLSEDHTGIAIAEKLKAAVENFKIIDKLHLVISDNAPNMVCAMRLAAFKHFGCVSHTIQLVLHDCLLKDEAIDQTIKKCRKIVGHFKRSEQATRHLKGYQELCKLPIHMLKQDVPTRWNSTFLMLERLFEQKSAIVLYASNHGTIEVPTTKEWESICELIPILSSFYEATLEICSDSACVSIVIPLIAMLRNILETSNENNHEGNNLKSRLLNSLNARFANIFREELMIASFLDPRFKTKYFSQMEINQCKKALHKIIKNIKVQKVDIISNILIPSRTSTPSSTCNSLWHNHDKSIVTEAAIKPQLSTCEQEIEDYLKEMLLSRNSDIFHYWHLSSFILLKKVALKFFSAPPTSVASEQLFSAAGQLYSDRRTNLLGENADKLLFLAHNIPLFDFEYEIDE